MRFSAFDGIALEYPAMSSGGSSNKTLIIIIVLIIVVPVVLVIGGALLVFVGGFFAYRTQSEAVLGDMETADARNQATLISIAAENLRASRGTCPTVIQLEQEGLISSGTGTDPWGTPYTLRCESQAGDPSDPLAGAGAVHVSSPGPDGVAGTADDVTPW